MKTDHKLFGPESVQVKVLGSFTTMMERNSIKTTQEIFLIKDLVEPLLGRPAIDALNLIERINKVNQETKSKKVNFGRRIQPYGMVWGK